MNNIIKYTLYSFCILGSVLFFSCEDVVDLDLEDSPTTLVVDAWINNKPEAQTIRLTTTAPYFDASPTPGVSGASIVVSNSTGLIREFADQGDGNYVWTPAAGETLGEIEDEFFLGIELDGKTYGSATVLNAVPPIDSINQVTEDENAFSDESITCNFFSRDLIGGGDTYWIKTFKNDQFLNQPLEINVAFDAGFSAGSEIDGLVFITPIRDAMNPVPDPIESGEKFPSPWAVGDEVRVEIHSIDLAAFFYLNIVRDQLLNSLNGIFAEPLINTSGNVVDLDGEEEVLGMFVVSAISELSYTIE